MTVLRSLRRSVAHHRMALGGYRRVNKHGKGKSKNTSFFSQHWYDYLQKTKQPAVAGNKKNKRNNHKVA